MSPSNDEIPVCPECNYANIHHRVQGFSARPDTIDRPDWYCNECGNEFETPDTKPRRKETGRQGIARKLATLGEETGGDVEIRLKEESNP